MAHRIIATEDERAEFLTLVAGLKLPVTFEWAPGRDRTPDQNRLQFLWAREAAEQRGDTTPEEQRLEWKLHHGVPIMRQDSPEFREVYDTAIKPLPYHLRLKAMQMIAVTSEMKVRQMVRYLDAIERECAERGIKLTDPDPDLASYQQRHRMKEAA